MAAHNELGKWGEDVAAEYLSQKGFRIIERNWKYGRKEIDIITCIERTLVFVEVKTRRSDLFGDPSEAVSWKKRRNLMSAMCHYMIERHLNMPFRFDIVGIIGTPSSYTITLYENAVSNIYYKGCDL